MSGSNPKEPNARSDSSPPDPSSSFKPIQAPLCDYSDSEAEAEDESNPVSSQKKRKFKVNLEASGGLDVGKLLDEPQKQCGGLFQSFREALNSAFYYHQRRQDAPGTRKLDPDTLDWKNCIKKPRFIDEERDDVEASADPSGSGDLNDPSASDVGLSEDSEFKTPKLRNRKFIFKPFKRELDGTLTHDESSEPVSVLIPEQLAASYGLYIWPSSPVLSWYLWLHQDNFRDKTVLELGAGTSLPGLLCAKIGVRKVYLTDLANNPKILDNCRQAVKLNCLEEKIEVLGLTWGCFDPDLFKVEPGSLNFIIGSDLFYDPDVFEPLCVTLSFLLKRNPNAKAIITVQDRSEDWSVEGLFKVWNLRAKLVYPEEFLRGTGMSEGDLTVLYYGIFSGECTRNRAVIKRNKGVLFKSSKSFENMEETFVKAADYVRGITGKLASDQLLYFYARYKQANEGKNQSPKPGLFNFQGRKKWQSWTDLGDMPKETAMSEYILCLSEIEPNWQQQKAKSLESGWVAVSVMKKEVEKPIPDSDKTIFDWIKEGNVERFTMELQALEDVNGLKDDQEMGIIHWVADRGFGNMIKILLDLPNFDVNLRDGEGQTALHYAASCGHSEIIECLLKHNDVNKSLKDVDNLTAMDVACDENVKKLLQGF